MKNLDRKRVLLLAPPFYNLHNQIVIGLQSLGAVVGYIPDLVQKYNPNYASLSKFTVRNFIRSVLSTLVRPNKTYHFSKYLSEYRKEWDYFICIDGYSFDKDIMKKIKEQNPKIKTILYLWDSLNFYNFKPLFKHFDKVYTFDKEDSEKFHLKYLPLFWYKTDVCSKQEEVYDISFIGSDHTDRITVLSKIDAICKEYGIKTFFKIVLKKKQSDNGVLKVDNDNEVTKSSLEKVTLKDSTYDFLTLKIFTENEVEDIINKSRCILDIVKPNQGGLSNRTIQALASQKKILTTNASFMNTYLDNGNIQYIDRQTPSIDLDFLRSPYVNSSKISEDINKLRIDNWLLELIGES